MIVEELRLRHWRGVRHQRTFRFGPGLNLLVGPNEAGKSTVFEALARALFDRHTSHAAELERVRPIGSTLGPEVQLVLLAEGRRYRVLKRFLENPVSQLHVERDGAFELDHEGDRADAELRRLLGGEAARGPARPDQRGLAQALWYLQRDESLPARAWSQALHEGLAGLMKVSLRTPEQDAVLQSIAHEHDETFTRTGRLRKGSELSTLRERVASLEAELAIRRTELERTRSHREELSSLVVRIEAQASTRAELAERIERIDERLRQAPALEEACHAAVERLHAAERSATELDSLLERLRRIARRIVEASATRRTAAEEERRLRAAVREHRRSAEAHARRWEEELEPKLRAARSQIEDLHTRLRVEQLELEERSLLARAARRAELHERAAAIERELRALGAPSAAEGERLDELAERAERLSERVRAAAARVRVELAPGAALETTPELARDPESGEFLVAGPARFSVAGAVAITVRSADESLERREREAREAAVELGRELARYGATELSQLDERRATRERLEAELATLRSRWLEAGGRAQAGAGAKSAPEEAVGPVDGDEAVEMEERRLAEIRAELVELRARVPQAVLPGIEGWAELRTLEQIRALEERAAILERSMRAEREAEQEADRRYRQSHDELLRLGQRVAASEAEASTLRAEIAEALQPHGEIARLEAALAAARHATDERRRELAARRDELDREVAAPRRERARLEAELRARDGELRALESARADRLARIEEAAALDLDGRVDDLEGRLAAARRRLEVVERRSAAARVLRRLVEYHQDRRARELVAPVAELVDRWLQHVTGRRYRGLALDDKLVPLEVHPAHYGDALPLDSLSFGTYAQVVVLLRLALATLLSREERQLVILDDRLVDADGERLARFCEVLAEVASSCQVLLATCREEPFRALPARVLRLGQDAAARAEPGDATTRGANADVAVPEEEQR